MPVVVVGAGLAGLACALDLQSNGAEVLLLDRDQHPGGRLKTDDVEGFRLDRGFQVAFTAYPEMLRRLDYDALHLRAFEPGALVWTGGRFEEFHQQRRLATALSPLMTLVDKFKLLSLDQKVARQTESTIYEGVDQTIEAFLRERGFSARSLDRFFRPFFGGIFLDRELQTSAQQFQYVWKMLARGRTVIPSAGIQAIADQLAAKLTPGSFRGGSEVERIDLEARAVHLAGGETLTGDAVVIATDSETSARLLGADLPTEHRSSTCLYFETPVPPVSRPILLLNGAQHVLVNEIVPCSVVAPSLAPSGRHLVSATVLGDDPSPDLPERVKAEVSPWFPQGRVEEWRHLRTYRIRYAQMAQPAGIFKRRATPQTAHPGVFLAGEPLTQSSINGALESGAMAAKAVIAAR